MGRGQRGAWRKIFGDVRKERREGKGREGKGKVSVSRINDEKKSKSWMQNNTSGLWIVDVRIVRGRDVDGCVVG